jgi:hypothetical protein
LALSSIGRTAGFHPVKDVFDSLRGYKNKLTKKQKNKKNKKL